MTGRWLALKITDKTGGDLKSELPVFRVSIPKKVVPLATQRNRIKRLIREVVRQKPAFKDSRKCYFFKVVKWQRDLDFHAALQEIDSLIGT